MPETPWKRPGLSFRRDRCLRRSRLSRRGGLLRSRDRVVVGRGIEAAGEETCERMIARPGSGRARRSCSRRHRQAADAGRRASVATRPAITERRAPSSGTNDRPDCPASRLGPQQDGTRLLFHHSHHCRALVRPVGSGRRRRGRHGVAMAGHAGLARPGLENSGPVEQRQRGWPSSGCAEAVGGYSTRCHRRGRLRGVRAGPVPVDLTVI